jgi:hypothetical protein
MSGGDPEHLEACRPVFDAIARKTVHAVLISTLEALAGLGG